MKQTLLRLREPAVVVVLVVLALRVLLAPVSVAYFVRGSSGPEALSLAFFSVTYTATDPLTVVVLAALLATCALVVPTRNVRRLTVWSFVVAGLGVLMAVVATIGWLATQATPNGLGLADVARAVLGLVVPVLAVVAISWLLRAQPRNAEPTLALDSAAAEPELPKEVEAAPNPANEPIWQPDVASGAAWLKAGDAASGRAASGWGKPGDTGGWLPQGEVMPNRELPGGAVDESPPPGQGGRPSDWEQRPRL